MQRIHLAILTLLVCVSANGAVFNVTNLNDAGAGSLRDAIAQANANPGDDTVNINVTGTIVLTSGQIVISGPVEIAGPGSGLLTIDANANGRVFSIFATDPACPALDGPDYRVTISGVRLTNARRTQTQAGGAIFSEHSLALRSVSIDHSKAGAGGALFWWIQYPGQSLEISDSQFTDNIAMPLVANPTANNTGGAISIQEKCLTRTTPVTVDIFGSLFSGNESRPVAQWGNGAAIAFFSDADITIVDTRVVDNHVIVPNPPVTGALYYGGGIYGRAKSVLIGRAEIADNTAVLGGGLRFYNDLASDQTAQTAMRVDVIDSTVSGNSVTGPGAGIEMFGNVALHVSNSTVSANTSDPTRAAGIRMNIGSTSPGGNTTSKPSVILRSSIVAGNTGGVDIGTADAIGNHSITADHSLMGNVEADIAVNGVGNLFGADPQLGPLAFNGGLTRTHALAATSPAVNAGTNPLALATDQRGAGYRRSLPNGATDIGAFQTGAASANAVLWVHKAYVGYYGRPADPAGLVYWAERMDREGGSLDSIIMAFGTSDEFNSRYGALDPATLVTTIYRQALSRDPDAAGLAYYLGELAAGRKTLQTITLDVLGGATGADSTTVANKLSVATYFTQRVDDDGAGCPYGSPADGASLISDVTSAPGTVIKAKAKIDDRC